MDGLRNVDLEAVARWGAVSSVLSWVGSASMICVLVWKRKTLLQTVWNRILLQLCAMYLLGNSVALLTEVPLTHGDVGIMADKTLCRLQAFFIQWLTPMDLLLNLLLLSWLYLRVCHDIRVEASRVVEPLAYFLVWTVPAGASAVLLTQTDLYGPAGAWCWVEPNNLWDRVATLYLWVWAGFVVMMILQLMLVCHLRRHKVPPGANDRASLSLQAQLDTLKRGFYAKLAVYSIVYMISWTPASVNRIIESTSSAVADNTASFACQLFFVQFGGFMFACLFFGGKQWAHGSGADDGGNGERIALRGSPPQSSYWTGAESGTRYAASRGGPADDASLSPSVNHDAGYQPYV